MASGELDLGDMLKVLLQLKEVLNASSDEEKKLKLQVEGIRVVRGPDWSWENQDKGEGQVGIVRIMKDKEGTVQVVWDHGGSNVYSAGYRGKHDLRILDLAQVGVRHRSVSCDECKMKGIWGIRWKCQSCPSYDLCTECYMKDKHIQHTFKRFLTPASSSVVLPSRKGSKKVEAKGLFAGAKVRRGEDWRYLNQDGGAGSNGIIIGIEAWANTAQRNCASVTWANGHSNKYRVGFRGYCDLRYVEPVTWGQYYPSHLPVLDITKDFGEEFAGEGDAERALAAPARRAKRDSGVQQLDVVSGVSGTRVIRGKDWKWGNQDNGPYNMGTVEGVKKEKSDLDTYVYWDYGTRANYRSGANNMFDLKIVDNAPARVSHSGIKCEGCGENPLRGIRWKCLNCASISLCTECYGANRHDLTHPFGHLLTSDTADVVKVPPRSGAQRKQLQGIFKGATVIRGPDWRWQDQDGGSGTRGTIVKRHEDEKGDKGAHCWFAVKWEGKESSNLYRVGLGGFIDLKAVKPSMGFYVYPDHLPDFFCSEEGSDQYHRNELCPYQISATTAKAPKQAAAAVVESKEVKNFSIDKEIGAGGFGKVYLCFDKDRGNNFALKRVSLAGCGRRSEVETILESFRKEIKIFTKLPDCDKVCRYLGSNISDMSIDIYLEFVPGGCLRDVVPLKESLARNFAKQTMQGLEFLHRHMIIHRDVKCANVLRDVSGRVKLTDFGVSTEVSKSISTSKPTSSVAGTVFWMAPEVINEKPYNYKIDVWSFACTLVEMLTGNPPNYDVTNALQVMRRLDKEELKYEKGKISEDCQEFLKSLFQFNQDRRPTSADALKLPYMRNTV